jgi:hypothetical protein
MKWVKHMTASWDDEGLSRLVGKGGLQGLAKYGLWWRVVEIVAAQVGPKESNTTVRYSITKWSLLLSLRGSLVFSALSTLTLTGGVTVERDGNEITVTIPNILKYRDEYSRKSGHARENVPPKTDQIENRSDPERELDSDRITEPSMVASAVLDDLRLSGRDLRIVLDEVCAREMQAGTDPEELRVLLVDAWRSYEQAKPSLTYSVGAAKFFGEIWRTPAGWPWKDGHQPKSIAGPIPIGRAPSAYELDAEAQREERRQRVAQMASLGSVQ